MKGVHVGFGKGQLATPVAVPAEYGDRAATVRGGR
jgi:hypothetical protein